MILAVYLCTSTPLTCTYTAAFIYTLIIIL